MSTLKDFDNTDSNRVDDRAVRRSGTYRRTEQGSLHAYRREHDDVGAWLDKLRTDDPVQLRVVLLGFRSVLLLHFAREEGRDGLFGLVHACRGLDHSVEALRLQHHDMLTRIHRLQSSLEPSRTLSPRNAELRDELVALVDEHEQRESALLQDVLLTDLGEGY